MPESFDDVTCLNGVAFGGVVIAGPRGHHVPQRIGHFGVHRHATVRWCGRLWRPVVDPRCDPVFSCLRDHTARRHRRYRPATGMSNGSFGLFDSRQRGKVWRCPRQRRLFANLSNSSLALLDPRFARQDLSREDVHAPRHSCANRTRRADRHRASIVGIVDVRRRLVYRVTAPTLTGRPTSATVWRCLPLVPRRGRRRARPPATVSQLSHRSIHRAELAAV